MTEQNFLFVPASYKTTREKELIYATSKAHTTKNAHRRNRCKNEKSQKDNDVSQGSVKVLHLHDCTIGCSLKAVRQTRNRRQGTTLDNSDRLHRNKALALVPSIRLNTANSAIGDVDSIYLPKLIHIISFAHFHMSQSWSPCLVRQIIDRCCTVNRLELDATSWLWHLWTSNDVLFISILVSVIPLMLQHISPEQTDDTRRLALKLKAKSFHCLRSAFRNINEWSQNDLLATAYHVKALFREACITGDTGAASSHAKTLEVLVNRLINRSPNIEYRRLLLWGDAVPALTQLRRPVIELSTASIFSVEEMWARTEAMLPDVGVTQTSIPDCVTIRTSQEAFIFFRRVMALQHLTEGLESCGKALSAETLFLWMMSQAEHHMCALLHAYFDLFEHTDTWRIQAIACESERHVQQAVILALLYIFQKTFFGLPHADGGDLNESALAVLPAMRQALQLFQKHGSAAELLYYHNLSFWILSVALWAERNLSNVKFTSDSTPNQRLEDDKWFLREWSKAVMTLGLQSCTDVREILREFAWCDSWGLGLKDIYASTMQSI